MKQLFCCAFLLMLLSGCAQSSGVNKLGPNTYTVSIHAAPLRGGISGARGLAFEEAEKKCADMGQEILVEKLATMPSSHFAGGTAELIFHCFSKDDPRLATPDYRESKPDLVIETR